ARSCADSYQAETDDGPRRPGRACWHQLRSGVIRVEIRLATVNRVTLARKGRRGEFIGRGGRHNSEGWKARGAPRLKRGVRIRISFCASLGLDPSASALATVMQMLRTSGNRR